ncbi:aminopeptidase P family protein [Candidatus Woesearchaeota archaeon]|nr:aminopeptidase P family protein [Candidatus Woesearchaeota archaeon]
MKINGLKNILEKKNLDFALFFNFDSMECNANMSYFSSYNGLGALIIPKKDMPFLLVPKMELERAKYSKIKHAYALEKKRFFESVYGKLKSKGIKAKRIGIDYNSSTLNFYRNFRKQFKNVKIKDISSDCFRLREIKTKNEKATLKKSCSHASKILENAIKNIKEFNTESEVAAFLEHESKKLGLNMAFKPIVASGNNASMPHYMPKNIKLKKGFCVIDFGVKYKGYCSDISRTIYLGNATKKEKRIYDFMLNTQKQIIENLKIGDCCGAIYDKCIKNLGDCSKYFIHGLGHGIGIEIHESPNITLNSKDSIEENMAFTIEPGIYTPKKFGIRIEDTIFMEKKPLILTKVTKDLLRI